MFVDLVHHGVGQQKRLKRTARVQALITHAKAENLWHSVSIVQLTEQRADNVV